MYAGSIKITHFDADCRESLNSNGSTLLNQMQSVSNQRALSGEGIQLPLDSIQNLNAFYANPVSTTVLCLCKVDSICYRTLRRNGGIPVPYSETHMFESGSRGGRYWLESCRASLVSQGRC